MTTSSLSLSRITFIGAGSMAEAVIRGLVQHQITSPSQLTVMNRANLLRLEELKQRYQVAIATDSTQQLQAIQQAQVILLCMKPKDVAQALHAFHMYLQPHQLLISVVAGLTTEKIQSLIHKSMPIVRTMPNTSCTIGLGATGMSYNEHTTWENQQLAKAMFEAIGLVTVVDESLIDIVTGISGSGPAYVYYMMEAMVRAAVQGGLTEEQAQQLIIQTFIGASEMVKQTKETPETLRAKVTSPQGTTHAAISYMEQHQLAETLIQAIFAARDRAKQLGELIQ